MSEKRLLKLLSSVYLRLIWMVGLLSISVLIGCHRHQPVRPQTKYGIPTSGFKKNIPTEKVMVEQNLSTNKHQ